MDFEADGDYKKACNYILWLVTRFPQTRKMLRQKLLRREFSDEIAEAAVQWAAALGYIDDYTMAETIVKKYRRKGYGQTRIKNKLKQIGVSNENIEKAIAAETDSHDVEEDRLLFLAQEILGKIPENKDKKRVLARRLVTKGYSSEEIYKIFQKINFSCVDIDCE
jgi:SOS response regulatory protein OraA/RecX